MAGDRHLQEPWPLRGLTCLRQPLVLTALLLGGTFAALPSTYESNDDPGIVAILSGADGFPASPDVTFLSPCFSRGLWLLSTLVPVIPWYGLCWLATIAFATLLMFSVVVDRRVEPVARLVYAAVAVPLSIFWISRASFTSAAMATVCAALVFVFRDATQRAATSRTFAVLALAMLLAYPWRPGLVIAVVPLVVPCLLYLPRSRSGILLVAFAPLTALVALDAGLHAFWRDPEATTFAEFNAVRSAFHDTKAGDLAVGSEQALAAAGWSAEDYAAFRTIWQIHDRQVFNTDTVRAFLTANEPLQAHERTPLWAASRLDLAGRAIQPMLPIVLPPLMLLILAAWLAGGWPRADRWRALAVVGFTVLAFAGLAAYRFVPRVGFPLSAWAVGTVAMLLPAVPRPIRPGLAVAAVATVLVSIGGAVAMFGVTRANDLLSKRHRDAFVAGINRHVAETGPRPIVVVNPKLGLFSHADGPFGPRRLVAGCRLVPCGWQTHSPRYDAALASLGIASGRDLMLSPDVLFAVTGSEQMIDAALRTWFGHLNRRRPEAAAVRMIIEAPKDAEPFRGLLLFRVTTSPPGASP